MLNSIYMFHHLLLCCQYRQTQCHSPNPLNANNCDASILVQVIPSNRLFYGSDPVGDSPYTVTVSPHKPSQPLEVSLAVQAWDEVKVSFMPPENDGGEAVEGYMVEWWSAATTASDSYGSAEIQTLKIGGEVDGES